MKFDWYREVYEIIDGDVDIFENYLKYPDYYQVYTNLRHSEYGDRGDLVALMTEEEYAANEEPYEVWKKFKIMQGFSFVKTLDLNYINNKLNVNENQGTHFTIPIKLSNNDTEHIPGLCDTGGYMTHIPFNVWKKSNMASDFFHKNSDYFRSNEILNVAALDFGKLPLAGSNDTVLFNGETIKTYKIRINNLILGVKKMDGSLPIQLTNITAYLCETNAAYCIIGRNVLNYLDFHSKPTLDSFNLRLDFTEQGKLLLERHRKEKNINNMPNEYEPWDSAPNPAGGSAPRPPQGALPLDPARSAPLDPHILNWR